MPDQTYREIRRMLPEGYFLNTTPILVVMGVSGCGKTTIGQLLAQDLGWEFAEGDDFHSQDNIDKMTHGTALSDEDRWPWLEKIRAWIDDKVKHAEPSIVTCSALKRTYRDSLRVPGLVFIYLSGDYATILERVRKRKNHYMKANMLCSQFETLQPPQDDEPHIQIPVGGDGTPEEIANTIVQLLHVNK